jgi:hypothetical protein
MIPAIDSMPKKKSVVLQLARDLVNTSVEDMQSGLWAYKTRFDLRVLGAAFAIVNNRGEKTKAKILDRKIRMLKKELQPCKTQ